MTWRGYFAIEDLNLSAGQRQTLVGVLRQLGPARHPQPAHLCHWRTRLDGQAAFFEAAFNEDNLTVTAFKARLAAIFGVDPATIDHSTQSVTFAIRPTPVVTFSRGGTDYLRMAPFGGPGATWDESRVEVLAYLAANRSEWEGDLG
jgi:hypothetical protein